MSYLDLPRVHFGGTFQASPSTLNNTPNNYDPALQQDPEKIELYWAPDGNGIFDLIDCSVTSLAGAESQLANTDSLFQQPVTAIYTKAPPKIVDLDPMQQNVSEIWGLNIQIGYPGGAHVSGVFQPTPFSGIWQNAQGPYAPGDSSSGAAYFQSVLTELQWDVRDSEILKALKAQSPDRLSMKFVLSAHNNHSPEFLFNDESLNRIQAKLQLDQKEFKNLQTLKAYRQMNAHKEVPGAPATPGTKVGSLPTRNYVYYMCRELIGEQLTRQHIDTIIAETKQKNDPGSSYEFDHGNIVGTIGPSDKEEPVYYTPARSLAPEDTAHSAGCVCNFAVAKNDVSNNRITLDLGDSLPVDWPGNSPWENKLGNLQIGYENEYGNFVPITDIHYMNEQTNGSRERSASDFIYKRAGILDIDISKHPDALSLPLIIRGAIPHSRIKHTFLREAEHGYSIRADQFVFRMNPGVSQSNGNTYPEGDTQKLNIYVRKFGEISTTWDNRPLYVSLQVLNESEAEVYTRGTVGTSGSAGIKNLSTPEGTKASVQADSHTAIVDHTGLAQFTLTATDPGNPRGYVDGQIYFIRYSLQAGADSDISNSNSSGVSKIALKQDPNNLVSIQNYDAPNIDGTVTWENGIGEILKQFGFLYPVMGRIGLADYDRVKINKQEIKNVLSFPISHPLHMPVTRDLSVAKRNMIIDWIDAGAPRGETRQTND